MSVQSSAANKPADNEVQPTSMTLLSLALASLLGALGVSIANVALPTLVSVFNAPFAQVQWVAIAYLLSCTLLVVSAGRLGDLLGHRLLLLVGLAVFVLASLAAALAPQLGWLLAARALQGVGAAILMALTLVLVRELFSKQQTGRAMGLLGSMSAIGTALGPSLGGVLIDLLGWRAIFGLLMALALITLLLCYRFLPTDEHAKSSRPFQWQRFDLIGSGLLAMALTCYSAAATLAINGFAWLNPTLLGISVVMAVVFIHSQTQVRSPLIKLALLRQPLLAGSLLMNIVVAAVMMSTLIVGPFYLTQALQLSESQAGLVIAVGPLLSMLSGLPSGVMVDRLGAGQMLIGGLVAMLLGALALVMLPSLWGVAGYILALAILTPGYQLFQASNNTLTMIDVSAQQRGQLSGLLGLARNLGLISGASVMGMLFARFSGNPLIEQASAAEVSQGMQWTFSVAATLLLLAVFVGLLSRQLAENCHQEA